MLSIVKQFANAFALSKRELGKTPIAQHNIRMKTDAAPIKHNPYRCSPKEL